MIGWNHLVEIERIEKLSLSIFPPPHHALLPADALATQPNLGSRVVSTGVLQHNPLRSGNSITGHYANRTGGAEKPRLPLDSPHAASLRTPAPNRRERNFLIRSAIILLAVDGNILSLPAAIWSQ